MTEILVQLLITNREKTQVRIANVSDLSFSTLSNFDNVSVDKLVYDDDDETLYFANMVYIQPYTYHEIRMSDGFDNSYLFSEKVIGNKANISF